MTSYKVLITRSRTYFAEVTINASSPDEALSKALSSEINGSPATFWTTATPRYCTTG